jgi:hypothetical protein
MAYDILGAPIDERTTPTFAWQIVDADGVGVPAASLASLTWWLFNKATGAVINSRNGTSILNANNGTVDGSGNATLVLEAADTAILDESLDLETHIAEFEFTYNGGARTGRHVIEHAIRNLRKVP